MNEEPATLTDGHRSDPVPKAGTPPGLARWSPGKITPPNAAEATPISRLFDHLDADAATRLVWVQGPPGAGKTTLAARYLAAKGLDPIWYRLDEDDADPATFFFYLTLADARAHPADASRLPAMRPEYLRGIDSFSRRYFRALFDRPERSVLVLDDYQEIGPTSSIHGCIAEGLKELPAGARIIVVSRAPPPKEFARLRLNGIVRIVPPSALRLTPQDAGLVARGRSLDVPDALIAQLVDRSHGWTAGLILLMEATRAGLAAPTDEGGSVPEVLFDYFAGEVFDRMDPRSQRILMTLAPMPTMAGPAATLLARDDGAVDLLEDLVKRNYFTVRDEDADTNYRFHPLFRDFLLTQAASFFGAAEKVALRARAAKALESCGQFDAAVPLYQEAGAWNELARLIRAWAGPLVEKGRHATLLGWIERLPTALVETDGWLAFWLATARFATSPRQSRPLFQRALTLFESAKDTPGLLLAWAGLASSISDDPSADQAALDGDIALLRRLMPAVPAFPSAAVEFRVSVAMYLALARRSADRAELGMWRDRALASAAALGKPGAIILIRNYIALYALIDGDFATVREQLEAVPPAAALAQEPLLQAVAFVTLGLAQLFGQAPGRCDDTGEQALAASRESGIYLWTHFQAGLEGTAIGDLACAKKWLRRTAQLAGKVAVYHSAHYQMMAAQVALYENDHEGAIRSSRLAVEMTRADGWLLYEAMARVGLAEALENSGDIAGADAELVAAEAAGEQVAILSLKVSTLFLRADFLLERGHDAEGLVALDAAMDWAKRTGARRTMASAARNGRVCARALVENVHPDHARLLIKLSNLPPPDRSIEQWPWPLKISTFGGLRIQKDGEPLVVSRKAPRRLFTLLKAIIAFGATNVPEIKLVDAVWPDEDGDAGHSAFDVAIHRLRKLIGDNRFLVLKDGRVSLDPAHCWLDVQAFESSLEPRVAPAARLRGMALYRGDFLPDDQDLPWTNARRVQLAGRFKRAQDTHARDASAETRTSAARS